MRIVGVKPFVFQILIYDLASTYITNVLPNLLGTVLAELGLVGRKVSPPQRSNLNGSPEL